METVFQLPKDSHADLERFRREIAKFEKGENVGGRIPGLSCAAQEYTSSGNRTPSCCAPVARPASCSAQMRQLAGASKRYGNGVLHVTTQQDVQIHRVLLKDIHPAIVELPRRASPPRAAAAIPFATSPVVSTRASAPTRLLTPRPT